MMTPMRYLLILVSFTCVTLSTVGCVRQVEGTGRTQLAVYNDAQMDQMGAAAYADVLKTEKKSTDKEAIELVVRVGKRLAAQAPDHGFTYEFTVLESATPNAFCLPGGKVAIYTGILGMCQNEAGIAAVMGHEIAHAIANHGNERMSHGALVQGTQQALGAFLQAKGVSPTTLNMSMTAFGLGANIGVMLPFSRSHELEADKLGLEYMSKAGYDPGEAVLFWQRFAALGDGGTPSFMSTHPASADRAKALQGHMSTAKQMYAGSSEKYGAGAMVPATYRAK